MNPADFSRNRSLTLEHVFGLVLSMSASRNQNGYDITSQNYFSELGKLLGERITPVRRQSVSEARAKLNWRAFEYLLGVANLESSGLPQHLKFKGHVTRAVDGTSFFTPKTKDLTMHFSPRKLHAGQGETHYPFGICVSAINVFTGQPTHALVGNYMESERGLLSQLLLGFNPGDLSLLDRGLGGAKIYFEYERSGQFFINRVKATGNRIATYITAFLASCEKERHIDLRHPDGDSHMKLRLILGPVDSEGKPIVFITNLLNDKRYPRKELVSLYKRRWSVETMYDRVKNLFRLENFHSRTHNGVMQEIFSCLLILSLTASCVTSVIDEDRRTDTAAEAVPSFKNAAESVRRHLFSIINGRLTGVKPKKLIKTLMAEIRFVTYPIRPRRSHPRLSQQPLKNWNTARRAKIRDYHAQRKSA